MTGEGQAGLGPFERNGPGTLVEQAVHREAMPAMGASGARFEKLSMPDGSRLIVKHFASEWDWMMRATHDPGRAALLWLDGFMDACPPSIDSAVVRVEQADPGWRLYLRDVSSCFLQRGTPITMDVCLPAMQAAAELHAAFAATATRHLCTAADLLGLCSPATLERETDDTHPFLTVLKEGWNSFAEKVPAEVAQAVLRLVDDPLPVLEALADEPQTLLHGDLHFGNLGYADGKVVMLDWGLATHGPTVLEWAWWAAQVSAFGGPAPGELLEAARSLEPDLFGRRGLALAPLVGLLFCGWQHGERLSREPSSPHLDWWIAGSRDGLRLLAG